MGAGINTFTYPGYMNVLIQEYFYCECGFDSPESPA